ncbi:TPA: ead/Ea22-like family protein [Escherichia coli]
MMTFTREQLATLRKIAQRATQGEWVAFISPGTDTYAVHTPGDERCGDIIKWPGFDDQKNAENNAEFIAAFNPKVVLELLYELETAKARIAELSEKRLAGVPTIPDEVLSAIRKVARMRVDSVAFDGDKRGLINALDEAEDALILTVSEYADEIATAEIKD